LLSGSLREPDSSGFCGEKKELLYEYLEFGSLRIRGLRGGGHTRRLQ
jgi:hypothetical protein